MKINKQYTVVAEELARVIKLAFREKEKDLGELLTLAYTCFLLEAEGDLVDMIKTWESDSRKKRRRNY